MKKLAIAFAVGTAKSSTDVAQSATDISSNHRYRHWRWGYRHHRPYYNSYGYYAPRRYGYYGPRYYGGGPGVTFSFGSGGYRGW